MATTTKTAKQVTRTIAGHKVTLIKGVRYVAGRPWISRERTEYPVTIQPTLGAPVDTPSVTIEGLTYDEANRFLLAFNNGPTSFDGRVW